MSDIANEVACDALVCSLIDGKVPNYTQFIIDGDDDKEYVVTVQRKDGETPCQQMEAMKREIDELREALGCLLSLIGDDECRFSKGMCREHHDRTGDGSCFVDKARKLLDKSR